MSNEEPFFEETFQIQEVDPDGKKFDKGKGPGSVQAVAPSIQSHVRTAAVSRFKCWGDLYELDLLLDINISIFDLTVRLRARQVVLWTAHQPEQRFLRRTPSGSRWPSHARCTGTTPAQSRSMGG